MLSPSLVLACARACVNVNVLAVVAALVLPSPAYATWSIVGSDPKTGQVGVAAASCLPSSMADIIGLWPKHGAAIAAQALVHEPGRDALLGRLDTDAPRSALSHVTDDEFDEAFEQRQYGVVKQGESVAFTGDDTREWSGHATRMGLSVQGNLLEGRSVVDDALEMAIERRDAGAPLAEQLMAALAAGSAAGGDKRCNVDGVRQTASSAAIVVADVDDPRFVGGGDAGDVALVLDVVNTGDRRNAVAQLQQRYERKVAGDARSTYDHVGLPLGNRDLGAVVQTPRQRLIRSLLVGLAIAGGLLGLWWGGGYAVRRLRRR